MIRKQRQNFLKGRSARNNNNNNNNNNNKKRKNTEANTSHLKPQP